VSIETEKTGRARRAGSFDSVGRHVQTQTAAALNATVLRLAAFYCLVYALVDVAAAADDAAEVFRRKTQHTHLVLEESRSIRAICNFKSRRRPIRRLCSFDSDPDGVTMLLMFGTALSVISSDFLTPFFLYLSRVKET
jgi:hypothetical protein